MLYSKKKVTHHNETLYETYASSMFLIDTSYKSPLLFANDRKLNKGVSVPVRTPLALYSETVGAAPL